MQYTLPTIEQLSSFITEFPSNEIIEPLKDKNITNYSFNIFNVTDIDSNVETSSVTTWIENINTLIADIAISYGFSRFYFELGIPDDPYRISPGRQGQSEQFFPNFQPQHFSNQRMFRIYAELTISKIFSVLDNLGTLYLYAFNGHDIVLDKSHRKHFHTIVSEITKNSDNHILEPLFLITKTEHFNKAKGFRNDIIHNKTPLKLQTKLFFRNDGKQRKFGASVVYTKAEDVISIINFLTETVLKKATELAALSLEDYIKRNQQ